MEIKKNTIVIMHYTLTNGNGKILETTHNSLPAQFVCGSNMFLTALEKGLIGLKAGDKKKITIKPEKAYGVKDNNLILKIKRSELPEGKIKIGAELLRGSPEGEKKSFRITGFLDDWVFLDGNHPWAGMELHYDVKIFSIHPIRPSLFNF